MANISLPKTEEEALALLNNIASGILEKDIQISIDADLRKDGILDSMQMLILFMEIENATGWSIPDTDILIQENWYNVRNLCRNILNFNSAPPPTEMKTPKP